MDRLARLALVATLIALAPPGHADETRLLRFPDIHGDKITFVYAGDIYVVAATGGTARRLTSHEGFEVFPKFSPDGEWIAFSGEYGGNREVFVIPSGGGTPRQLTFYNDVGPMPPRGGFDDRVLDWTPDGSKVLFRANRLPWGVRMGRPYLVPVAGGMEEPLAVPEGGGGMFSPDGKKLVYTPIDREFRTWKRYRGGRAQDVWIYDLEHDTAEQLTDDPATDNQPLWVGDTIYFTSDRDYTLNLYAYVQGGEPRQVTHHRDFDVLWPSAGPAAIVYENGGDLYRFDPATETSERVPIEVTGDLPYTLPHVENVRDNIDGADLAPGGKRAVFEARGELFTVPAEKGEIRNLTRSPGVREIAPAWSPDGREILYWSDASGEYELYLRPQDGSGEERRITTDGDIWRFPPVWSPDGKKVAYSDKKQRLRYVELASGKTVDVDHAERSDITDYRWSPDSRWLVYTKVGPTWLPSIWVYDLEGEAPVRLTDGFTGEQEPVFDPEGRYLYFLSNRDYDLTFSGYEFDYVFTDPTRVYVGILAADGPAPFPPESDEVKTEGEEKDNSAAAEANGGKKKGDMEKGGDKAAEKAPKRVEIDAAGFAARVVAIPGPNGNYRALSATAKGPLYLVGRGPETKLKLYDLEARKEEVVLEGIGNYALSPDAKHLLFRSRNDWGIAEVKPGQKASDGHLDLAGLELEIDPRAEWRQMYVDAWRILRDWFYDPGHHGMDWEAIRDKYAPLVDHVAHRADLDSIFGEIAGELNSGHVYVNAGDQPRVERIDGGLLGAEIEADSGAFRIAEIFPGENWHEDYRSPLTEPAVDVQVGDYILAVDGRSTQGVDNFYRLLKNTVGHTVTLSINDRPDPQGAREVKVRPIARETNLRYLDWVASRRAMVDRLSGGRIGYVHLPNTAFEGNRELYKQFLPQAHKEALIIDVRYNGGGFIPDQMIDLVDRDILNYWARRGLAPNPTPLFAHDGPKACLINGYSSSGGDAFPYYFRKRGLGPLIGTRTWGGLIGLSGNPSLADGGSILAPTFRFLSTEGSWAVENEGVAPDIEVVDRPDLVAAGHDPTIEKAVEVLLEELRQHPPHRVEPPPAPTDFGH